MIAVVSDDYRARDFEGDSSVKDWDRRWKDDRLEPAHKKPFDFLTENNQIAKQKKPLRERKTAFLKTGSPGGTRTPDQLVNSQLLYRLSYRGNEIRLFIIISTSLFLVATKFPEC